MPEVSGFEVVAALKGDGHSKATPILILTAQTLTEADRARLGDQILGIVTKGHPSGPFGATSSSSILARR